MDFTLYHPQSHCASAACPICKCTAVPPLCLCFAAQVKKGSQGSFWSLPIQDGMSTEMSLIPISEKVTSVFVLCASLFFHWRMQAVLRSKPQSTVMHFNNNLSFLSIFRLYQHSGSFAISQLNQCFLLLLRCFSYSFNFYNKKFA